MIPTPFLVADLLDGNTWDGLGKGELTLPEGMFNKLLASVQMPLPIVAVELTCQSGLLLLTIKLDLNANGLPLRPQVQQLFELERVRIDPINKFVLIKPVGGLRIREETLSRSRLSPMGRALVSTILHTPTLLKLVRDRFPRQINYDNGRLHINLAGLDGVRESLDRDIELGHVKFRLLDAISIRDIDIRKGRVVVRYDFQKEKLLERLNAPAPDGYYRTETPPDGPETNPARMLPSTASGAPPASRIDTAKRVISAGRGVGRSIGRGLINRFRNR